MSQLPASPAAAPPPTPRLAWSAAAALVLAICVVVAASWSAQASLADMNAVTDKRAQARTGRLQILHVLSLFKDVETGARGFVISGQESYLEPYTQGTRAVPEAYARLHATLEAPYPEGFSWEELDAIVKRRLELAAQVIAERRQLDGISTFEFPLLEEGRRTMDRVRELFATLDAHQAQRVDQLDRRVFELRRQAGLLSILSTGLAILLLGLAAALLLRERQFRRRLEEALRHNNRSLESVVAERTGELSLAHQRLADFAAEQERQIEAERRRLSREVHDQIGQVFTAIRLIFRSLPAQTLPADQETALEQALDLGIASTRRITAELRPPLLDDLGLAAALQHFAEEIARHSPLACTVEIEDQGLLSETQKLSLFRIVQEATTNILRHAAASRLDIAGRRDGREYRLQVRDDGRGFDPGTVRPGALGLVSMRERAALIGGECSIAAPAGAGTCVEIRLPLGDESTP